MLRHLWELISESLGTFCNKPWAAKFLGNFNVKLLNSSENLTLQFGLSKSYEFLPHCRKVVVTYEVFAYAVNLAMPVCTGEWKSGVGYKDSS